MKKRWGLFLGLVLALSCMAAEKPNVLFLTVDDWNDMMGAMGDPQVKTPNLDRLARRGMVFTNAQAPGVFCAPSRSAILSGVLPFKSGAYDNEPHLYNHPEYIDIPEHFKNNGYTVAGGGKIYHHMNGYVNLDAFDEYFHWNPEFKKTGWRLFAWGEGSVLPQELQQVLDVLREHYDMGEPKESPPQIQEENL